jgi:hypothetical protein
MTTATASQAESLPQRMLGLTVKHAAFIFAMVYGTGFLVLSIHHGRLGIDAIEPFKPKVFSAGLLFVVLAGVPCIAMARLAGLFGLRMPTVTVVDSRRMGLIRLSWVLDFWWIAVGLRMGSALLFTGVEFIPRYPGWLLATVAIALWVVGSHVLKLKRHPLKSTFMNFGMFVVAVAIFYKYMSHEFFLEVIWFYSTGLIFLWIHFLWNSSNSETYDWERNAFSILGLVLFFALFLYGHIRSIYGGGAPIRVDVIFNRPTSFSASTTANGFVVDQDSHGYYIIHQEEEKEAHFIPREAVAEIVFHGDKTGF